MSKSQELIEKLAKQKTAWLDAFKQEYTEYRERKSGRQKEKLTVSNFNSSGIKKNKK